jgi:hypothetical protein
MPLQNIKKEKMEREVPELKCAEDEERKAKRRLVERPLRCGEHDATFVKSEAGCQLVVAVFDQTFVVASFQEAGTAAQAAGVRVNDRILAVNGAAFKQVAELSAALQAVPAGQRITLRLLRLPAWYARLEHVGERRKMRALLKRTYFKHSQHAESNTQGYELALLVAAPSLEEYRRPDTLRDRVRGLSFQLNREILDFDRKDLEADRAALVAYRALFEPKNN